MKNILFIFFATLLIIGCGSPATETSEDTAAKVKETQVIERDGLIYMINKDGSEKKLTSLEGGSQPIFLEQESQVIFVRDVLQKIGDRIGERKQIVSLDVVSMKERILSDKNLIENNIKYSQIFPNVENLTPSFDHKDVYFITGQGPASKRLVKLNIATGEQTKMFAAENFTMIAGEDESNFIIDRSEIRDNGRQTYHMIISERGEKLIEFDNEEAMLKFKANNR